MLLHQPLGEWMLGDPVASTYYSSTNTSPLGFLATVIGLIIICIVVVVVWKMWSSIQRRWRRGADRRPGRHWVRGSAQITAVYALNWHRNAPSQCQLDVVLSGPGIPPTTLRDTRYVKRGVRPGVGMTVPAWIDPVDPKKFAYLWDELSLPPASARQSWPKIENQIDTTGGQTTRSSSFSSSTVDLANMDATTQALVQSALNNAQSLLNQTGSPKRVSTWGTRDSTGANSPAVAEADTVALLERLAILHAKGDLSDAQFEQQKAIILG